MMFTSRRLPGMLLSTLALAAGVFAQGEPFTMSNSSGVVARFSEGATGWRWTELHSPNAPEGGWAIAEEGIEVATSGSADTLNRGWVLLEQSPDKVVLEQA